MTASHTKLKFYFHNPNAEGKTADYIADILVDANLEKAERMLREADQGRREGVEERELRKRTPVLS